MKRKNRGTCSIGNCGLEAKCRGLCSACYSWCRKFELRSKYGKKVYLENFEFRMNRMVSRLGIDSGKKILSFKRIA
jgi:hypothetical protein